MEKTSQIKTFFGIIALLFIIASVPIGVYLVQKQQTITSKAAGEKPQIAPETSISLVSKTANPKLGARFSVDVLVRSDTDPATLFTANIVYPKELLEVVAITNSVVDLPELSMPCGGVVNPIICPGGFTCVVKNASDSAKGFCESKNKTQINYFMNSFLRKDFSNDEGKVTIVGELNSPGFKTNVGQEQGYLATIIFESKGTGSAAVKIDPSSRINRSFDSLNILKITKDLNIIISP